MLFTIVNTIFIYIPAGKTILYLYYVYRTTLLETVAGPWLLFCTVNCIFILLVWYYTRVEPVIDMTRQTVADELRWEEERIEKGKDVAQAIGLHVLLMG